MDYRPWNAANEKLFDRVYSKENDMIA